jgi:hypothetical protein
MIVFSEHNFEDHKGIDHESVIAWVEGEGFRFMNGFIDREPTNADLNLHGWTSWAELKLAYHQHKLANY